MFIKQEMYYNFNFRMGQKGVVVEKVINVDFNIVLISIDYFVERYK